MSTSESDRERITIPDLTEEQIDAITERRLTELKGAGWIPTPLYRALFSLVPRLTVEIAFVKPSKETETGMEVLLTQRTVNDPDFPNEWHIPGAGVQGDDPVRHYYDNYVAIGRVFREVGGDLQTVAEPFMLDTVRRAGDDRTEVTMQYWIPVLGGQQEHGEFFAVENGELVQPPAEGLVTTHDATVRRVATAYQGFREG